MEGGSYGKVFFWGCKVVQDGTEKNQEEVIKDSSGGLVCNTSKSKCVKYCTLFVRIICDVIA